jgi:two-component system cell cycle response regulator DivK
MAGELILIVEDNEKNMKLVRDLLQFKGYRTLEAANVADGIALAAAHHPDLVLMDIRLPGEDGVTGLRRLRARPGLLAVPVVALTAFAMREDRERLLDAGFDGYLSKPIDVQSFFEHVRHHCQKAGQGR